MSDIWNRKLALDDLRRKKLDELMDPWLKENYYPALKQLVKDCAKEGHDASRSHSNGLGWNWFYCGKCGGRTRIVGPDNEIHLDDGVEE